MRLSCGLCETGTTVFVSNGRGGAVLILARKRKGPPFSVSFLIHHDLTSSDWRRSRRTQVNYEAKIRRVNLVKMQSEDRDT